MPESRALIADLDQLMRKLYCADACFLTAPEDLVAESAIFLVARDRGAAVGCGSVVPRPDGAGEVKRMWTSPAARRRGVARSLVRALEARAAQAGLSALRLETGVSQPEAIAFYEAEGFRRRGPFGDYTDDPALVFFEKALTRAKESAA